MTKIQIKNQLVELIDKAWEARQGEPRPHMGASLLGHHCDRWLWLNFRWAVIEKFEGRILRLFDRGHKEEYSAVQNLRDAGMVVTDCLDDQKRVKFGKHVSGSLDGQVLGVPQAPKTPHLLEIKTHGVKSFKDLKAKGVKESKWTHFVQMQVYMHGTGLTRALYYAVCKDNDEIYLERIVYDESIALEYISKGQGLAMSDRMPEPCNTDPTWYLCKWCPAYTFCHQTETSTEKNCRTCAFSKPEEDSTWTCGKYDQPNIPFEFQLKGCDDHELRQDLNQWADLKDIKGPKEVF